MFSIFLQVPYVFYIQQVSFENEISELYVHSNWVKFIDLPLPAQASTIGPLCRPSSTWHDNFTYRSLESYTITCITYCISNFLPLVYFLQVGHISSHNDKHGNLYLYRPILNLILTSYVKPQLKLLLFTNHHL